MSEYRVKEFLGCFDIQKKEVRKVTTGYLWWKKTKEVTTWNYIDKWGNSIWNIDGYSNDYYQLQSFYDLETAISTLNKILEGNKYHKVIIEVTNEKEVL